MLPNAGIYCTRQYVDDDVLQSKEASIVGGMKVAQRIEYGDIGFAY